ncbi:peptidase [Acinetobacter sp. NCu2D-2]|uniref:M48 family metallopeptidase n=1 Tax=Acinetobacter sp. NCu2D-2 TaxID=1608473 RepID=UPI0007CDF681|nr:M48 family metallopeptidase [Acinetobacter sp. NCu2D-2]ANF81145.1 peptidase [Acinetobacter sp. NCu2D-2]
MSTQQVNVIFYDGIVSKPRHAILMPHDSEQVQIKYDDSGQQQVRFYPYKAMTLIGALGQVQPVVELIDDARIEFQTAVPEWFNVEHANKQHAIWKLERSPKMILVSLVFVVFFVWGLVQWGIPTASHHIAHHLPEQTMVKIGNQAEDYLMEFTQPSKIDAARQAKLIAGYQAMFKGQKTAKVIFRQGGRQIGANALAIPNNTIVVTDELVQLVHDDRELLGVLAHEQGHLHERHSLEQAISGLGISTLIIMITGDASDLLTSVPVSLVGLNYSRKFELEADQYALKAMHQQHIPVHYFADFLARLEQSQQGDSKEDKESDISKNLDFLSTHPATEQRIQAVKAFEAKYSN